MQRSTSNPLGLAILAFCSGFLALLFFHQVVIALAHAADPIFQAPWSMRGVPPFQVPYIVAAAFWGGLWSMVLGHLLRALPPGPVYWITWVLVGAVALSLVEWVLVMPFQGFPMGGGWHPGPMGVTLAANAAWGFGTAVFLRLFGVQRGR